jgi:hypothetical protein
MTLRKALMEQMMERMTEETRTQARKARLLAVANS